ncbi:MAG: serine hydrolase, partial [Pseudomonadota bacterium]
MHRLPLVLLLLAGLACLPSVDVHADNGAIAYSSPLSGIEIDGDLSDWPADRTRYPIQINSAGDAVDGDAQFEASFMTGYDLASNSIVLAVEVTDQRHVVDPEDEADWISQDGVIVYFDRNHEAKGSGSVLFSASGPHRRLLTGAGHWDADIAQVDWDLVDLEVVRNDQTTTYEWRIRNDRRWEPNSSLGLDVLVIDSDDETFRSSGMLYVWGPGFGKSQAGGRTGDLLLIEPDAVLGQLQGTVDWHSVSMAVANNVNPDERPQRVRIVSTDDDQRWVQAAIDDDGRYRVRLPVGDYTITIPDRTFGNPWQDVFAVAPSSAVSAVVEADAVTTVEPLVIALLPRPDLLQAQGVLFDFSPDDAASVDRTIETMMAYYQVPGVSVALVKDAELVYHRTFGTQNAYSGEPVRDDTLFEAASITKIVFAFAVNRMAERGEIDLDKPLYEYLPFEDIAHDERYKKITARHALSHQTGFPNWRWQNEDGVLDLKFYPGIKYGYSGEGFEYLGRVAAHIADKPLEQLVLEETQQPMGLVENT